MSIDLRVFFVLEGVQIPEELASKVEAVLHGSQLDE